MVSSRTRLLVQGITGRQGRFHTELMIKYGTRVVAGVVPGKGGMKVHGVPVYDTVAEALDNHPEINASIVFVPAKYASDAVLEAVEAEIPLIVVITEHIPVHHTVKFVRYAELRGTVIVGPNTPGVITPGEAKVGIMPERYFAPGRAGIVSRSGTLTYEVAWSLSKAGIGISTAIGIGGDPVVGLKLRDAALMLDKDAETDIIVVVGEIGGTEEEALADAIASGEIRKPVVTYIAGRTAPPGRRMGHAGAIVYGDAGTAESKIRALRKAGAAIVDAPTRVGEVALELLKR